MLKGGHKSMAMTTDNLREVIRCPDCGGPLIRVPVLACTRCEQQHPLRCFTYSPRPGQYVAECVDLDLLAQGETLEEAIGKLQAAVFSYLEVAFTGESTKGLVLRLSPRSHRLRYHLHRLRYAFYLRLTSRRTRHFLLPASAPGRESLSHC